MPSRLDVEPTLEGWLLSEGERLTSLDVEPMPRDLLLIEGVLLLTEDVWPPREELMPRDLLLTEEEWPTRDVWPPSEEDVLTSLDAEHMPGEWLLREEPMLNVSLLIEDVLLPTGDALQLIAEEWPSTEDACTPRGELTLEG